MEKILEAKFLFFDKFHTMAAEEAVLEGCVLLTLLCGVHMWYQSSKDKNIIQVSQHQMERKSLGVTMKDKVQNTKVR